MLVTWCAYTFAPNMDEVGHLVAGQYVWKFGKFDLYRVNPPLVRTLASLPLWLDDPDHGWVGYNNEPGARPEWRVGLGLFETYTYDYVFRYFFFGRLILLPFFVVGALICFFWARDLYGPSSGVLATFLWCFSPNIIGWAATLNPDLAATSMGVSSAYFFWRWLQKPSLQNAVLAGLIAGCCQLTKFTFIVLLVVYPLVWLVHPLLGDFHRDRAQWLVGLSQLSLQLVLCIAIINLGYSFDGSFKPLREHVFVSYTLAGEDSIVAGGQGGNRFTGTIHGNVPVPLPQQYVSGIDLQKVDFEEGRWCFLGGEWKFRGWWYYYVVCLLLKVPLGTLTLAGLAALNSTRKIAAFASRKIACRKRGASDEICHSRFPLDLMLLAPAAVIFVFVSSQTGFTRFFRYVIPCLPFLFIWASQVVSPKACARSVQHWFAMVLVCWSITSSLFVFPHCQSYFSELAGGPLYGHRYLVGANIDWGQDVVRLKNWLDEHPEAHDLSFTLNSYVPPRKIGILTGQSLSARKFEPVNDADNRDRPIAKAPPGWYAISIHHHYSKNGNLRTFLSDRPVAIIGYTIYVYEIRDDEGSSMPEL